MDPSAPILDGGSELLATRVLLDGWAGSPRWGLILGLSLLAGALAAGIGYAIVRGKGQTVVSLVVGAAFLTGGTSAFLVVADQDFAIETPDRPCAAGPWTVQWAGSPDTYAVLPDEGTRGVFDVARVLGPTNGTLGPWGGPAAWTDARMAYLNWDVPRDRIGNASNAEVYLISEFGGPGLRMLVQISGSGDVEIARNVVTWALENATGASPGTVDAWVRAMPDDEEQKGYVEVEWTIENATFDPERLIGTEGSEWARTSEPFSYLFREQVRQDLQNDHPYPPVHSAIVALQSGNWTMGFLPGLKVAEGILNGTETRFRVTSIGETTLQTETYLPNDEWPALADAVYEQLGLGEAPDRAWNPSPGAVC